MVSSLYEGQSLKRSILYHMIIHETLGYFPYGTHQLNIKVA